MIKRKRIWIRIFMVVAISSALAGLSLMHVGAVPSANPQFQRTWERTDKPVADLTVSRTWMWGPTANTAGVNESYTEAPGGQRLVQYYDKSRMEDNTWRNASAPWDVTNGLLVVELMTGQLQVGDNSFQQRQPAQVNVGGDADDPTGPTYATMGIVQHAAPLAGGTLITQRINRQGMVTTDGSLAGQGVTADEYAAATNHRVASVFWSFMNSSGLVWQNNQMVSDQLFLNPYYATGYPVTEAYWANIKVGGIYKDVLLQCFERRCLTYTPGNQAGWQVEAGNVGQHYYTWRYGQQPPPPGAEETLWVVTAPSGPFVTKTTQTWEPIPNLQRSINMLASSPIAITITAEAGTTGGRLAVRALVDGQVANPSDALLTSSSFTGVYSYTFVLDAVAAGQHFVETQWYVDSGYTASLGDRSLSISVAPSKSQNGDLVTRWAHGTPISTTSNAWIPIPDMSTSITTVAGADLAITLSADAFTSSSMGRVWVRAVVDGQPVPPGDVIFAQGDAGGTQWRAHSMTFTTQNLAAGMHNVQMEWFGDPPYTAIMGDRTLVVMASPANASNGVLSGHSVESGWVNTSSTAWEPIPGMNSSITTPGGSDVAITFSAEVDTTVGGRMFVRALIDGQPAAPSDVMFVTNSEAGGSRSFTFTMTGLSAGSHNLHLEWTTDSGHFASVGDRTVIVVGWPVQ